MNIRLPWWTWVLPLFILLVATWISAPFAISQSTYWLYLPVNLAIVMSLWWGPRVLVATFLNALVALYVLKIPNPMFYPIYAIPETLQVALAWAFVKERFKTTEWTPSPPNLGLFTVYGIAIPSILMISLTQGLFVFTKVIQPNLFLNATLVGVIGDILGSVFVTLPALILITPALNRASLSSFVCRKAPVGFWQQNLKKRQILSLFAVLAISFVLIMSKAPLQETWYLLGVLILLASAIYGLPMALFVNSWIFLITMAFSEYLQFSWQNMPASVQGPATLITIAFISLITGSAVTGLTVQIERLQDTEGALSAAKEQAEEASRAKSEFLARMSHEIRTPLNSVLGILELLKETPLTKDQERYLSLFSHAGENLKALINDLLDFSKIEAKAITVENVSYNLYSTIRSVFEILQIKAEEKGLKFNLIISPEVPSFQFGDATRLRQVLFNLIGNALKFTEEGEVTVHVKITHEDIARLVIEIRDTGIGISREKQAQLFSPFFQNEPQVTRQQGGAGLGLVISKNLVEIMGGTMELKSLAGRGSTFRITLPHRPDLATRKELAPTADLTWLNQYKDRRFQILLVDDSEDNRVLMIQYLKKLPFDCDEATNGKEAVDKYKMHEYDLVFMDMQMPVMTGYKATELIRAYEAIQLRRHTPIIALTAAALKEDLERTLESGCDAYAVKPVKKSEILKIIAQSLTTKEPSNNAFKEPPSASM